MPPPASLLSPSIDGGAGGRGQAQQALRAVEGLRPSDQALYLYAHKVRDGVCANGCRVVHTVGPFHPHMNTIHIQPWIGAAAAVESNQEEEELAAMAKAAAVRWAS